MYPLRVWHIPQIPGKPFHVQVRDPEEAITVLDTLANYDDFQFRNRIKPDYANAQGLAEDIGGEWAEWYDKETALDIKEYKNSIFRLKNVFDDRIKTKLKSLVADLGATRDFIPYTTAAYDTVNTNHDEGRCEWSIPFVRGHDGIPMELRMSISDPDEEDVTFRLEAVTDKGEPIGTLREYTLPNNGTLARFGDMTAIKDHLEYVDALSVATVQKVCMDFKGPKAPKVSL